MMAKFKALKKMRYGGAKRNVGDVFDVKPHHERLVRAMGATRVAEPPPPPPAPAKKEPEKKKEPPKAPPDYSRRDMTAASAGHVVGAMMAEQPKQPRIDVKPKGEGEKK